MTSTRVPEPGPWPVLADAGHLLVSALHQDEPPDQGEVLPPQHKPLDIALLARVASRLKALNLDRVPAAAVRDADLHASDLAVWPLFAGLGPLGALPTAPRLVRSFAALVLRTWGLTAFQDDTELLLSELATNVVAAATGPDARPGYDDSGRLHLLWARLLSDHKHLRIEVWDTVPAEIGVPVQRQAQLTDESGRGLGLLDMLSAAWGWEAVPGRAAKKVWAELPPPSD